ncbi:SusC/RagA family TonB-linked outer membrane protein [Sphingobacterium athyrii]|uniref:SusC/RagA family TonB-linked outer membrane protein n=1 Tax=Sphingobacterium athyrii TaxID=2152717 RepID=A0A363NLS7_9SPHI|nr:TonB-dependent receptor [Sphingobacterium athyrii]PUV21768.1 SusC/RagA family TonB-linked outer membrane protein [Sphingobacterium athyrii]
MKGKFFILFLCLLSFAVKSQTSNLQGRVLNETGRPLPGVTVTIKASGTAKTTDENGRYTIAASSGQELIFSLIGFHSKTILFNGESTLDITLQEENKDLEEVVVIGYQTIKKSDLTGAVSVFNPKEMKNTTVTGTVGDALATLPGLSVRTAGNPGAEGKVEIRGTGTFGSSTPLYVVDGVVSGANRDFNFNDIESIQVLKDASAAAIYGSRAGNGVIIITTKQGKEGQMKIELSSRATAQWLPRYNLADRNLWLSLNDLAFSNGNRQSANHFEGNTDWQEEVFKTGWLQDQQIAFSGGSKESRYYISGNYQANTGTTIGTSSKRFTLRSNMSTSRNFGEHVKLSIGENIVLSNFNVHELNTNPIVDVYRMLPTIPIYDENNAAKGGYGIGDGNRDVTFGTNPFAKEDFEQTENGNLRTRGNVFTELELFKSFKYRFNFGFDLSNDRHMYLRKEGFWTYNQPYDPSSLNKNQAQYRGLVYDNTLEYAKKFDKHDVSAVAGISYQTSNYEQLWGTKNNVLMSGKNYFTNLDAALDNPKTGNYQDLEKLFSLFGRVNYAYDDKYLFSFTMRRDESSKFNPDYRVGYFPSVSAGWRISKEDFFQVPWINDLKLRANYGVLGTSNIGVWDWVSFINVFPQVAFGIDQTVQNGMTQVKLANADLKWEKVAQLNAGFDAQLFSHKLNLSLDYFIKETKDVLTPMQILMATGNNGGNPYVNAASLRNTGIELATQWRDNIGEFGYQIGVNASYIKNKILKLGYDKKEFTQWDTKSKVGSSIGNWYLIKTDGLFRSDEEVQAYKNSQGQLIQPNAKPGDVKYIDFNDDGQITDADRQYLGRSIPLYQLGMNLGLEYKGFDFQVQLTGAFGFKSFNGPRSAYDRFDDNSNYRADYDPWTPENPNAKDPRPIYADSRNVRGDQDRWLENGNYVKVRQLALGYNLPRTLLGKTLKQVRFYVNAQNLITFTSYRGLDPEFLNGNIWDRSYDGGAFPNAKGFTFGAQITF